MTKQIDDVLLAGAMGENAAQSQEAPKAPAAAVEPAERRSPPRTVVAPARRGESGAIQRLPAEVAAKYPLSADFRRLRPEVASEEDKRLSSYAPTPADIEQDDGMQRITRQVGTLPVHMTVTFELAKVETFGDGSVKSVTFSKETVADIKKKVRTAVLSYFDLWKIVMTTASRDKVDRLVEEIIADEGNYYMTAKRLLAKIEIER